MSLKFNDFSSIKIGAKLSDVKKIDPLINTNITIDKDKPNKNFNSYHLLKDGIVQLEYAYNEEDGMYHITNINFTNTSDIIDNGNTVKEKISNDDYPE